MFTRILALLAITLVCATTPAVNAAADAPATEATIRTLLETTHARQLIESIMSQMDAMMKQAMQQATGGQAPPTEVEQIFEKTHTEIMNAFKQEFTYEKLVPMYIRVYQKSFTEAEMQGMIAFYKTPTGQAVINKLPTVMQSTMNETMQMMQPVFLKVQRMQQDMVAEMKKHPGGQGG